MRRYPHQEDSRNPPFAHRYTQDSPRGHGAASHWQTQPSP